MAHRVMIDETDFKKWPAIHTAMKNHRKVLTENRRFRKALEFYASKKGLYGTVAQEALMPKPKSRNLKRDTNEN